METESLDSILNGTNEPAEAVETAAPAAEETVTEAPATQPRDDHGRFAAKGEAEKPVESAPPALEEQHHIPPKALHDERRRRQEAEQQLAELQQRLAQPQQPAPSLWEDEQGWQQHFGGQVVSEAVQAASMNARLDMSEMMVRQSQTDFEEKKAVFLDLMAQTPGLQQKALADPHPWNFAYQYVTNHQRMQELSAVDVNDLTEKLKAQVRAEIEAEQASKPIPSFPTSLADSQSARNDTGAAPPTRSLKDILGR